MPLYRWLSKVLSVRKWRMPPPFLTSALSPSVTSPTALKWVKDEEGRSCENQHMADCKNWTAECVVSGNGMKKCSEMWLKLCTLYRLCEKKQTFLNTNCIRLSRPTIKALLREIKPLEVRHGHWSHTTRYWNGMFLNYKEHESVLYIH